MSGPVQIKHLPITVVLTPAPGNDRTYTAAEVFQMVVDRMGAGVMVEGQQYLITGWDMEASDDDTV